MATSIKTVVFRVAVIYLLGVLAAMTVGTAVPEVSFIAREFHPEDKSILGLVVSMPSLVVAVGALLAGFFVDKLGDKKMLFLGTVLMVAGDATVIASSNIDMLLAGRFISGLGYVLVAVSAITMLVRLTPIEHRTMALAVWSTFVPLSFIIPFLTSGWLRGLSDWRGAFYAHAAASVLLLVICLATLPSRDKEGEQVSRTRGVRDVLKSPWPYLLGLGIGGDAFLHVGIMSVLGPYLAHKYGADPAVINVWNIGAMVLNMLGCLLFGKLLNKGVSPLKVNIVSIILTGAPALAIFAFPIGVDASIACSWIFMFFSGLLTGMIIFTPSVAPTRESMGATSGLVTQLTLLGVLLSAPVFFGAMAAPSPTPILIAISVGLLVCLFRIPILSRIENKHSGADAAAKPVGTPSRAAT